MEVHCHGTHISLSLRHTVHTVVVVAPRPSLGDLSVRTVRTGYARYTEPELKVGGSSKCFGCAANRTGEREMDGATAAQQR